MGVPGHGGYARPTLQLSGQPVPKQNSPCCEHGFPMHSAVRAPLGQKVPGRTHERTGGSTVALWPQKLSPCPPRPQS